MNLKPLHDWAVIRPSEAAELTAGGLYIPETAKDKPHEGVVEAIGPGAYEEEKRHKKTDEKKERRFIPATVKPGDRVLYEQYAGQTYTIAGEDRILVRERDILGILPERPEMPRPRPLQIPASTTHAASAALIVTPAAASGKSTGKKAAAKPVKKAARKPAAKAKKASAGKTGAAKVKKAAKKKTAAKPAKKSALRPAKTTAKKKTKKKSR